MNADVEQICLCCRDIYLADLIFLMLNIVFCLLALGSVIVAKYFVMFTWWPKKLAIMCETFEIINMFCIKLSYSLVWVHGSMTLLPFFKFNPSICSIKWMRSLVSKPWLNQISLVDFTCLWKFIAYITVLFLVFFFSCFFFCNYTFLFHVV